MVEGGGEGAAVETEKDRGGGKQGDEAKDPSPLPPYRRADRPEEDHEAREGREEMEAEEEEERHEEEGDRDRETPRGAPVEVTCVGGDVPPPEENADPSVFIPESAHLLL